MDRLYTIPILVIITLSFCLLAIPYSDWWFNGDDFGGLHYAAKTQNIPDIIEGNPNKYFYYVSNTKEKPEYHFSNVYYRPFLCLTMLMQYKFFGVHGFYYLLFNVFIHTINALLLFFLLLYFVNTFPALIGSIFFLFHPQIGFRFGHMANSQYYLNLTFFFLIVFLLKKFWDSAVALRAMAGKFALMLAYVTFFISVFTRETSLIIPLLIPLGSYLYVERRQTYTLKSFFSFFKKYFFIFLNFGLISLFYLIMRWYFYPPAFAASHQSVAILIKNFFTKSYEWVNFIYDFYWLSWLPYGTKKIKLALVGLATGTLFFFFQYSRQKITLLFLGLSLACLLWPAILLHYSPRYLYEVLPVIILLITCSLASFKYHINPLVKKIFLAGLSCFALLLMFLCTENLSCRTKKMDIIRHATLDLITKHVDGKMPLCFLSFPLDGFGEGLAHAIWTLSGHFDMPIIYDDATRLVQCDCNIVISNWWRLTCSNYFTKNYVTITPVQQGFRFTSTKPNKIIFFLESDSNTSLGENIVHKKSEAGITDFTLVIDQKWLALKPVFIIWNYEKQSFEVTNQ